MDFAFQLKITFVAIILKPPISLALVMNSNLILDLCYQEKMSLLLQGLKLWE